MAAEKPDPVLDLALRYENATLAALKTLEESDRQAQQAACRGFADALTVFKSLPAQDYRRAQGFLAKRALIPDHAWTRISAALETFAADQKPDAAARLPLH